MLSKLADFIRTCDNFTGDARLFEVNPPHSGHDFVIVSKVNNGFAHETYIFPSNAAGEVTDWGELNGSTQGEVTHKQALENAGYGVE